jgi:C-terminal processing protease CtpA/Prc
MRIYLLCFICFLVTVLTLAQNKPQLNLDFETVTQNSTLPDGWEQWGNGYAITIDNSTFRKGTKSVMMTPAAGTERGFGAVAYPVPLYKGKEIELKGYIKYTDVVNGFAGLFLRIDGEAGVLEFNNMKESNLTGTADWKEYSIKLPLPYNAKKIYVGALLAGAGTLWADNFTILVDGSNIENLSPVPVKQYAADNDKEFDNGSPITTINSDANTLESLRVMGLVWGYLKYYHPAVAEGKYNWDYELIRILPKYLGAATPKQRDAVLKDWIASLGSFEIKASTFPAKDVKLTPDLDWIEKSGFSNELKAELLKVKDARRTGEHYYISLDPQVLNPVFKNELQFPRIAYPDAGLRLVALYRYWNMIQYYFPNKHLIEKDWKNVLAEFVPRFVNAQNELEYRLAVLELIESIHDTHANIWSGHEVLTQYFGSNNAAPMLTFAGDEAVVKEFHDEEKGKATGLLPGDVITEVNGKKTADIVKSLIKHTPASNYPTKLRDIADKLLKSNESMISVKYRRKGKEYEAKLKTYSDEEMQLMSRFKSNDTCFRMLNSKIAYLYPGSLKQEDEEKIIKEIQKSEALVIDLRCYPNTFIVFSIGELLSKKPTPFVKFSSGSIQNPGLFTVADYLPVGGGKHYEGKVVVLVNEITQSNAEYTAMAFRASPNVTVMGSTTAGADGNVSAIKLPGGIHTMISGLGVLYPDGKETQRIGIVPDIEVKPTVQGIAEGRDEVLEKAAEYLMK